MMDFETNAFNAAYENNVELAIRWVKRNYAHLDAEVVAQDAFVKVWRNVARIVGIDSEESRRYVMTAVKNCASDAHDSWKIRPTTSLDIESGENVSFADTLVARPDFNAAAELVAELSEDLTEEQRIVVMMRAERAPFAEIADALGISEDTAKKRYNRARQQMLKKHAEILAA